MKEQLRVSRFIAVFLPLLLFFLLVSTPLLAQEIESEPLSIGALLSLTGAWASIGESSKAALLAALPIIERQIFGGDTAIHLMILDTESNPQTALRQLEKLHEEGARLVIGPMTSAEAHFVRDFAQSQGLLLISPSATSSQLSRDDALLTPAPKDRIQVEAFAQLLANEGINRVAMIHIDDLYGQDFYKDFQEIGFEHHIGLLPPIPIHPSEPDYQAAVNKLEEYLALSAASTAVLLVESDRRGRDLMGTIDPQSLATSVPWYVSEAIAHSPLFLEDSQVANFAATVALEGLALALESETFNASRALLESAILEESSQLISTFALTAWDSLWLIAYAHARSPFTDASSFSAMLLEEAKTFVSSMGFSAFIDDEGHILPRLYHRLKVIEQPGGVYSWKNIGSYVSPREQRGFFVEHQPSYPAMNERGGDVTIGALVPLTGELSYLGLPAEEVLKQALIIADQYFATAAPGVEFSLEIKDTRSDPGHAFQAMLELYQEGIRAFIGPYSSNELRAVSSFATRNPLIMLSPSVTSPYVAHTDRALFLTPSDEKQAKAMASHIESLGFEHVALLYRDDIYGRELAEAFEWSFQGRTDTLWYDFFIQTPHDLVASLEELLPKEMEGVAILAASYDEIASIFDAIPADSPLLSAQWFGFDGTSHLDALITRATVREKAAAAQFTASIFSHYGLQKTTTIPTIRDRLAWADRDLTAYDINTYDAFWFLATVYGELGAEVDVDTIWSFLTTMGYFPGIGSAFVFDRQGYRSDGLYVFHTVVESEGIYRWELAENP